LRNKIEISVLATCRPFVIDRLWIFHDGRKLWRNAIAFQSGYACSMVFSGPRPGFGASDAAKCAATLAPSPADLPRLMQDTSLKTEATASSGLALCFPLLLMKYWTAPDGVTPPQDGQLTAVQCSAALDPG
ncbi:MAG: hypothetical protein WCP55_24485, partial [Lentisphaerota bacterium]